MMSSSELKASYSYIEDTAQLENLLSSFQGSRIGIDTEFIRTDTFYPKLGLLQLQLDTQCYLIDPLKITDFSCLRNLFEAGEICFVFHACGEDLDVLKYAIGAAPTNLLDTQIAAAYAGYGSQLGYQAVVNALEGVELPKGETRSDWMQRPLTEKQKIYAALDVLYLLPMAEHLEAKLQEQNRWEWVLEEYQQLSTTAGREVPPDQYYLTFKNAWQLNPRQLQTLKHLAAWRERKCHEDDQPRPFIIKDAAMFWVVENLPKNKKALAAATGMKGKAVGDYGDEIIAVVQKSLLQPVENLEAPERPLSKKLVPLSKELKGIANKLAEELNIPPEWVLRKRWMQDLIVSYGDAIALEQPWQVPEVLNGWRKDMLLPKLKMCLEANRDVLKRNYRPSR